MVTPVEFLTARYDEREAKAKAATPGPWQDSGTILAGVLGAGHQTVAACNSSEWDNQEYSYPASAEESANSAFIAANDPAYVLADIAAKRAILELHEAVPYYGLDQRGRWLPCTGEPKLWYCGSCQDDDGIINGELPCDTLRILAAPFADHPDYNPAWQL